MTPTAQVKAKAARAKAGTASKAKALAAADALAQEVNTHEAEVTSSVPVEPEFVEYVQPSRALQQFLR